ncbi:MAG TPA: Rne/Rng family ribonuclease [Thermodesulfovibrionales bacterium]|nr:Rne/Rng family ribonuclease [Thermodesulfovibrionales bacterium]
MAKILQIYEVNVKKRILINALHPEEKRVAIVDGDKLVDFYVETAGKEHLKGNIYKGKVVRVEPGLQAAFVDFGQKKHGFLQLREIKPEFFQKKAEGNKRPRIQEVISKGHELIVQVEKDERDNKGASLTTYISIPGRYIVMMPGQEKVGVSRKIEDREDRGRLKEIFSSLKLPKKMGFILRTAGSDKTEEDLDNDLKYLTKLWSRIQADSKKAHAPALIYKEQDFAVKTVRDYLASDVAEVLIDDPAAFKMTKEFLKKTSPWRKTNITLYKEKKPIFGENRIEEQIAKIYERYVYLPSRGYIVIDKTEALTAIDVNSGRSRKEEHIEATALRTNLEAADEIARQLRLRDLGGLIVVDFIDMESSKNRREVEQRLRDAMSPDKAHFEMTQISKFGIVEMTRERMRPAYQESIHRKCELCAGTGVIKSDEMVAVSALREIHVHATKEGVRGITCRLPVDSMNYMINTWRTDIADTEKEFGIPITLAADVKLLPGQYKVDVDLPTPVKEHVNADQRQQKQPHQKQQPLPATEQAGPEPGAQPAAVPTEQKRRRKRRPRRGKKGARKEGTVVQTEEAAPAGPLSDPIKEGI